MRISGTEPSSVRIKLQSVLLMICLRKDAISGRKIQLGDKSFRVLKNWYLAQSYT